MLREVKYLWQMCFLSHTLIFKVRSSNLIETEMLITYGSFFFFSFYLGACSRGWLLYFHTFSEDWHILVGTIMTSKELIRTGSGRQLWESTFNSAEELGVCTALALLVSESLKFDSDTGTAIILTLSSLVNKHLWGSVSLFVILLRNFY